MSRRKQDRTAAPAKPFPARLAVALGLAALALLLFWPAVGFDYIHFDDTRYVQNNPHVTTGLSAENLRWAFSDIEEQWWLPVLWISFMLDTELFGPGPMGHHLVNILLHALNTGLLFWALSRMLKSVWPAAFVAALFALHPLRVEAVAWITARKDVLSGLFFFLALLAYLRHARRPSATRMALVAALMLLGLLSKAILITLPPLLLLLDYWPLRRAGDPFDRREWKTWGRLLLEKWPLILLAAVFVCINLYTHSSGRGDEGLLPLAGRLALMPPNVWAYVGKIVWPHPLAIIYPEHDVVVPWITVLALLGLVLVTAGFIRLRKNHPALLVGWLWFLIALLPVVRGLRLGLASMADRFTYIPAIGLFLLLAFAAADFVPAVSWRRPALAAAAALLLAAGFAVARNYLLLWRTSEPLFRHGLAVTRENYMIKVNLASVLRRQGGQLEEELDLLRDVLRIRPRFAAAHGSFSVALREDGHPETAEQHLDLAARYAKPNQWELHRALGVDYFRIGRREDAIRHFRLSLQQHPHLDTQLDLGAALLGNSQPREALAIANEALGLHPNSDRAHYSRGRALQALDRPAEAIQSFQSALRLLPGKVEYQNAHALALAAAGRDPEAVARFRKLIRQYPDSPEILNNLASILAEDPASPVHDPAAAVSYALQAADRTQRQDPRILDTLAMAYAANGQCDLAIPVCTEAETLARKHQLDDLATQLRERAEACRNTPVP